MEMDNGDSDYEQYIRDPALYMHMKISFIVELKRKEVCSMSSACVKGGCDGSSKLVGRQYYF